MKMSEFLSLSEDEKEEEIAECGEDEIPYTRNVDEGTCSQCGGPADIGDYCFGCRILICQKCFEEEPHLTECVAQPLKREQVFTRRGSKHAR